MWMVLLNGAWQPADTDEIVIAWIRQGIVRPETRIRHSSWAEPMVVGSVQNFRPYLPPALPMPQDQGIRPSPQISHAQPPTFSGKFNTSMQQAKVVGLVFIGLLLARATYGATAGHLILGVLLSVVLLALVVAIVAHKFIDSAPAALRGVGEVLLARPILAVAFMLALGSGTVFGLRTYAFNARTCDDFVAEIGKADSEPSTFAVTDPMEVLRQLTSKIERARPTCTSIGATNQVERLAAAADTLSLSANMAACDTAVSEVSKLQGRIGDKTPVGESMRLLHDIKKEAEAGIDRCSASHRPEAVKRFQEVVTKLKPLADLETAYAATVAREPSAGPKATPGLDPSACPKGSVMVDAASGRKIICTGDTVPKADAFVTESCETLATMFGPESKLSDLQKDEAWKSYQGKAFKWDLRVTEVSSGLLGGYSVQWKCATNSRSLIQDIQIDYPSSRKQDVLQLEKGESYTVRGILKDHSTLLGLMADPLP
ncbi:MAG: hypothetical protein ACHREM_06430 [Polyangiales bacterium]